MARKRKVASGRMLIATLFSGVLSVSSCTTFIEPVKCQGPPFTCNEHTDVKFCEYEALSVQGADCSDLGLAPVKDFCVVTTTGCVHTSYAVKGRDCRVQEYRAVRDWRQCPAGTPTFNAP
jgi:hypothetical protein